MEEGCQIGAKVRRIDAESRRQLSDTLDTDPPLSPLDQGQHTARDLGLGANLFPRLAGSLDEVRCIHAQTFT